MSYFFAMRPLGAGSADIECLASYLSRLANLHHVTLHQLIEQLRWWDKVTRSRTHMVSSIYTLRLNGYSSENAGFVRTLIDATGIETLSSCTLLAMQKVGAGNGISALKRYKAWCPACYGDWIATDAEPYDKLIWQIDGTNRCELHGILLETKCPACDRLQGGKVLRAWSSKCHKCGASLLGNPTRWIRSSPDVFESQITSLLTLTTAHPELVFDADATVQFRTRMYQMYDRKELQTRLGDSFRKPFTHRKMQLRTLVSAAQFFGVSLAALLQDPNGVSTQPQLNIGDPAPLPERYHRGVRQNTKPAICAYVRRAIAQGPPYPTINYIAATHGCSTAFVYSADYRLLKKFSAIKRAHMDKERKKTVAKVIRALKRWLREPYGTLKSLHRKVADVTGTPLHVIREVHQGLIAQDKLTYTQTKTVSPHR